MSEFSHEQELELLMSISEAIDPSWKIDYSIFSDEELRMVIRIGEKEERGEALAESENSAMLEAQKKAESTLLT